jgi:4'-phosphopantetheinyl transferase
MVVMAVRVELIRSPVLTLDETLPRLSAEEADRVAGYRDAIEAARFATGRALLRAVAGRHLARPPERVRFSFRCAVCGGAHGRPEVAGLHTSVSHSGDWVLVAAAGRPVGVDVERVAVTGFDGFADFALHPGEVAAELDRRAEVWVRKEALLKLHGLGLSRPPNSFTVCSGGQDDPLAPGFPVTIVDLDLDAAHRAALAVATPTAPEVDVIASRPPWAGAAAACAAPTRPTRPPPAARAST